MNDDVRRKIQQLSARMEGLSTDQILRLEKHIRRLEGEGQKECFVMMPFGDTAEGRDKAYWTKFFHEFLTPALARCGYSARRSEGGPDNIVKGIMEDLAWTERGLAVLTDRNPNVWYELGVRHSFRRSATVMVCQQDQIERIPFDLQDHGVAGYSSELAIDPLVAKLQAHFGRLDAQIVDSPVAEFSHSGLAYCIHRALAGLRTVKKSIDGRIEDDARQIVSDLNVEWRPRDLQVTIVKHGRIFVHRGEVQINAPAGVCWEDAAAGNTSRYNLMRDQGHGLWMGSIVRMPGRLTACAYETIDEWEWLVVVEAHISQADF